MIYKYGGFYLDLDYVVFNDLRKVVNLTAPFFLVKLSFYNLYLLV